MPQMPCTLWDKAAFGSAPHMPTTPVVFYLLPCYLAHGVWSLHINAFRFHPSSFPSNRLPKQLTIHPLLVFTACPLVAASCSHFALIIWKFCSYSFLFSQPPVSSFQLPQAPSCESLRSLYWLASTADCYHLFLIFNRRGCILFPQPPLCSHSLRV